MEYRIRVGEREFVFTITGSGRDLRVTEDGKPVPVDIEQVDPVTYSLLVDGEAHLVTSERTPDGLVIHHQGRAWPTRMARGGAAQDDDGRLHSGEREVRTVMPGVVSRLLAGPGDAVVSGTPLVVLEAMKMENEVRSHRDGVIREVHVREGEPVEAGALLVTLGE